MSLDFATDDIIRQLRQAETDIPEWLLNRIRQAGPLIIEPLLNLALDREIMHKFEVASNSPVHALRLLGDFGDTRIITPLLRAAPMTEPGDTEQDPARIWDIDLPQILARLGAPAIESLWAFADSADEGQDPRAFALISLAFLAHYDPEQRDVIIAGLTKRLREEQNTYHASALLTALVNLGVAEIYPEVMAGYREKRFETKLIPPGRARQLLLNKGSQLMECVNHTLAERYEKHPLFGLG